MKAVIFSLFGKLIPKRRLLSPGKKTDDILQRGQKANKIGEYYYISYATSALRVIAWIVLIVGVIGSIVFGIQIGGAQNGTIGMAGTVMGIFVAVGGIIGSFLAWVFLLATSELFYLFMDVEENTRNTAERILKESD